MSPDTTAYVLPLTAPAATQVAATGGKGAMLARLHQAGLPVPQGCILTSHALTSSSRAYGQIKLILTICK